MRSLDRLGVVSICASSVAQCRELLAQSRVGLIFCDRRLSDGSFTDVLHAAACNSTAGKARVVLMSCVIDPEEYHAARGAGLFEVIPSPTRPTDLEWMVILAKRAERTGTRHLVSVSPRLSDRVAN
jgi:DNA-binding NtrC family response regulator